MTAVAGNPRVDVIVPIHQLDRPIDRAVDSVMKAAAAQLVRVIVVCHGVSAIEVKSLIAEEHRELITFTELFDGIPSPAGPVNAGLALADAEFVFRLDSDDYLLEGSIDRWLERADATGADAVLAPLKTQDGATIDTPRRRPRERKLLDAVKDRVAYCTAPRGLLRLETIRRLNLQMAAGVRTGEDIMFGLQLWFSGTILAMGQAGTGYVLADDVRERVTNAVLPMSEELAPVETVLRSQWFAEASKAQKHAIAVKFLRNHVIAAILRRGAAHDWADDEVIAVEEALALLQARDPKVLTPFCRRDRHLLTRFVEKNSLSQSLVEYHSAGYFDALLTQDPLGNLDRESNFRYYLEQKLKKRS